MPSAESVFAPMFMPPGRFRNH